VYFQTKENPFVNTDTGRSSL